MLLAKLLGDLLLDRQSVVVPARDIRRAVAFHRLVANDEVLEELVQGVADVNVAVGIRRAVVEYEIAARRVSLRAASRRCAAPPRTSGIWAPC